MKNKRNLLIILIIFYIALLVLLLALIIPSAIVILREDLVRYWGTETIIMVMFLLIACLMVLIFALYSIYSRGNHNENNENSKFGHIDDERSYLERQINEITKKLLSTDERWMEAYHLIMSSQDKQRDKTGKVSVTSFLRGFGIDAENIEIQGDLVFVLTPFHNDFAIIYDAVCETCKEIKLRPIRGDEDYVADDILKHIIKSMVKSRLVIAVLDGRNPNVFYELGIAHSLGKPTILLANKQTQVPFDLKNQFLVLYENEKDLNEKLKLALLNILTSSS